MRRLVLLVLLVLAEVLAGLALAGSAGARSAESVTCSSTSLPLVDLSGSWSSDTGARYQLKQKGSCLWWIGGTNTFFGTVFGLTVSGVWADVSTGTSGTLTLSLDGSRTRLYPRSTAGSAFPSRLLTAVRKIGAATATNVTTLPK